MKKKDFDLFKKHVVKWRDLLGERGWSIKVDADKIAEGRDAECSYDILNRCALITIADNTEGASSKFLEATAMHEILELVMADIRSLMGEFYNENFVDQQIHRVIRRLENALK